MNQACGVNWAHGMQVDFVVLTHGVNQAHCMNWTHGIHWTHGVNWPCGVNWTRGVKLDL